MILYEDAALVVLDKPAGLSSEEGVPAALRQHWDTPDAFVGVVHRLDTGVSGLMVYARTPAAAAALSRQVTQSQDAYAVQDGRAEGKAAAPQFVKQYRAVLAGVPDAQLPAAGVLRDYLFKDSRKGRVFPVSRPRKGVREAVLEYRILATAGENSLAELESYEKPLELALPIPAEAAETAALYPECWLSVEDLQCSCTGGALDVSVTVRVEGAILSRRQASCVGSIALGEKLAPADPEISLRIYYAQAGEALFAIAKRYHVSPGQMLAANDLAEGTTAIGKAQRLLIPGA